MATEKKTYYCERCGRTMVGNEFYTSHNREKYPNDGKLPQCKKCITAHVDNWDPETYKPILKEIDVPYIKQEWDNLLARYGQDPTKLTGMTIIGRYLSKMKLNQWKGTTWDDTEKIAEKLKKQAIAAMEDNGLTEEEIEEQLKIDRTPARPAPIETAASGDQDPETGFPQIIEEPDEFEEQLSEEDKIYLKIKWGKGYRAEEWVKMEQLYEDMMASYDIQSAGHKDTLKMICKTSLKANQLLDCGDIDGFQKMSKAYDTLMKSGKFTAAQNKGETGEYIDSIGELVALCEKEGFIPRYYTDGPQDKVDRVLEDLQSYTRALINDEANLGNMIENSMKEIENDRKREAETDEDDENDTSFEEHLFSDQGLEVTDQDFEEFNELEETLETLDEEFLKSLAEEVV